MMADNITMELFGIKLEYDLSEANKKLIQEYMSQYDNAQEDSELIVQGDGVRKYMELLHGLAANQVDDETCMENTKKVIRRLETALNDHQDITINLTALKRYNAYKRALEEVEARIVQMKSVQQHVTSSVNQLKSSLQQWTTAVESCREEKNKVEQEKLRIEGALRLCDDLTLRLKEERRKILEERRANEKHLQQIEKKLGQLAEEKGRIDEEKQRTDEDFRFLQQEYPDIQEELARANEILNSVNHHSGTEEHANTDH